MRKNIFTSKKDLRQQLMELQQMVATLERHLQNQQYKINDVLLDSKEIFKICFENISDIFYLLSMDYTIVDVSPSVTHILGFNCEDLIGKKFYNTNIIFSIPDHLFHEKHDFYTANLYKSSSCKFVTKQEKILLGELSFIPVKKANKTIAYIAVAKNIKNPKNIGYDFNQKYDQLRKALGGTIQAIAMTVETRDPYTAGHQKQVADLARAIATKMDMPEESINGIRMAGAFHDLGKVSIPSEILSKPGRLSDLEFQLIQNHSQIGYDILKNIDFPWPVADIVLQHHERLNGTGYPNKLKGNEILIEARILGVSDVVEAMSAHRPYRASLGVSTALREISENRGILYDPDVVDVCYQLFEKQQFHFN